MYFSFARKIGTPPRWIIIYTKNKTGLIKKVLKFGQVTDRLWPKLVPYIWEFSLDRYHGCYGGVT